MQGSGGACSTLQSSSPHGQTFLSCQAVQEGQVKGLAKTQWCITQDEQVPKETSEKMEKKKELFVLLWEELPSTDQLSMNWLAAANRSSYLLLSRPWASDTLREQIKKQFYSTDSQWHSHVRDFVGKPSFFTFSHRGSDGLNSAEGSHWTVTTFCYLYIPTSSMILT